MRQIPTCHLYALLLGTLSLAGCASMHMPTSDDKPPQNVTDFITQVQQAGKTQHWQINRSNTDVNQSIKAFSNRCLNTRVRQSRLDGISVSAETTDYNPMSKKMNAKQTRLILQAKAHGRPDKNQPRGGQYILVADVKAIGPDKSDFTVYTSHRVGQKVMASLAQTAQGKPADCPDLKVPELD